MPVSRLTGSPNSEPLSVLSLIHIWRMALVSLITIPVGMMCYMGMMKEYPKKYGEVVKAGNHMSATTVESVSYTHLDVYKRQVFDHIRKRDIDNRFGGQFG